ncbi:MAG: C39 family peptidase [Vicinamibacterales bacterium]
MRIRPVVRRFVLALALCAPAAAGLEARAGHEDPALLAVPYLAQPEALCGGAAVAMVMRYWGDDNVYPDDFAPLLDRAAEGIHADMLARSVRQRGWTALEMGGPAATPALLQRHLSRGRPVVALVRVAPETYHFVVVVGWTADEVVLHDPARAPYRRLSPGEFEREWTAAERWALLIVPGRDDTTVSAPAVASGPPASRSPRTSACDGLVASGVDHARLGDLRQASSLLEQATGACPADAAGWRELAGVRFLESNWPAARTTAERATRLDPGDPYGWRLLASSRFLDDDAEGALDAWNQIGEPAIDEVSVDGLERTRHPVVDRAAGLRPREALSADHLRRARHRLEALPAIERARVSYKVGDDGRADVTIVARERALMPKGLWPLATLGGRALLGREVKVDVASPTGSGEVWSGAWRFWPARPRVALGLAVPSPGPLPGVTSIDLSWERQTYAAQEGVAEVREGHRRAGVLVSDWLTGRLRWELGASLEGWSDRRHAGATAGLDLRLLRDRVALGVSGSAYAPGSGHAGFTTSSIGAAWRSTAERSVRSRWLAHAGVETAGASAPLDLWPGAGAGHARAAFLRAHPLLSHGVLEGPVFGRQVAYSSVEYQHAVYRGPVSVDVAAFTDAAQAWSRRAGDHSPFHVDIGVGFRASAPGVGGTVRLDFAKGLRDGGFAVSAGWAPEWPWR